MSGTEAKQKTPLLNITLTPSYKGNISLVLPHLEKYKCCPLPPIGLLSTSGTSGRDE